MSSTLEGVPATTLAWSHPQPISVPLAMGAMAEPAISAPFARPTPMAHQSVPPLPIPGFSLSPASEPFPQKLVDKVRSGQFVEMREMLTDNIALLQQLETFNGQCILPTLPGALKPRLREVTALPSWLYCFLAYVAIRSPDPATRDMLAYARLLIREAQRHGGDGWMKYDRVFRQQVVLDRTMKWNVLNPDIQAATLVGRNLGQGIFCTLCREPGHRAFGCALAYLNQSPDHTPPTTFRHADTRARPQFQPRRRYESHSGICVSWNRGSCIFPNTCTFRHICATCRQRHMARDCAATPSDSEYKNIQSRGQPSIPSKDRPRRSYSRR